jgi:hypothetical protein
MSKGRGHSITGETGHDRRRKLEAGKSEELSGRRIAG